MSAAMLSAAGLVSCLLDALEDRDRPSLVFLLDDLSWSVGHHIPPLLLLFLPLILVVVIVVVFVLATFFDTYH